MPKTFLQKLSDAPAPHVVRELPQRVFQRWMPENPRYGGTMLVSSPREIESLMQQVGEGELTTTAEIAKRLAKKHKTDITCPMTTGIFTNIVAGAAQELRDGGAKAITPFWRTLKSDGSLNEKYPGGTDYQRRMLEAEGHIVVQKGKRWVVQEFQEKLVKLK
jgi:6-O-methylguanine DNA methyltransferase, DNA binding domain